MSNTEKQNTCLLCKGSGCYGPEQGDMCPDCKGTGETKVMSKTDGEDTQQPMYNQFKKWIALREQESNEEYNRGMHEVLRLVEVYENRNDTGDQLKIERSKAIDDCINCMKENPVGLDAIDGAIIKRFESLKTNLSA